MRNLYTIITRSRKGTIIKNNKLTSVIGNPKQEDNSTDSVILNTEAIEAF